MNLTSEYANQRMQTRHAQAAHARLAAEARATRRVGTPGRSTHRTTRLRVRGLWFPGRPINLPG